ncbi:MAG: hypothetical protein IPK10_12775 [Bacteroidetes bacterium]|nr:hypothetical protein [Bacteroidota bacterium]
MKNLILSGLGFTLLLFISSCKKDDETFVSPIDITLLYFPIDSGLTRYYNVDSVYWDSFTNTRDTVSYPLKETIAGTFIDNQGRLAQRIERFKLDIGGNWIIYKVWSSHRNAQRAEKVEDNIRFVKLVFSITNGITWNGNAYNTLTPRTYEHASVGIPDTFNGLTFSETVLVKEDDEPANLLNDYYAEEKYAKNIGCYFRYISDLEFNFISGDTVSGFIYTEKLTSYTP